MKHIGALGVLIAIAVLAGAPAAPAAEKCPRGTRSLPANAIAGATDAALAAAPRLYKGKRLKGTRATRAALAVADPDRGGYPRQRCGRELQRRSVIVSLEFPAELPSASLSQGVVVVVRGTSGYRVWAVLH